MGDRRLPGRWLVILLEHGEQSGTPWAGWIVFPPKLLSSCECRLDVLHAHEEQDGIRATLQGPDGRRKCSFHTGVREGVTGLSWSEACLCLQTPGLHRLGEEGVVAFVQVRVCNRRGVTFGVFADPQGHIVGVAAN